LSFGEVPVVGSDCGVDTSISPVADCGKKALEFLHVVPALCSFQYRWKLEITSLCFCF